MVSMLNRMARITLVEKVQFEREKCSINRKQSKHTKAGV